MNPQIQLIHNKAVLEGTAYFEFLPGQYTDRHWNDTSVFLDEEIFCLIERPFIDLLLDYDHYAFDDITAEQWQPILAGLKELCDYLREAKIPEDIADQFCCVLDSTMDSFAEDFKGSKADLIRLIEEFTEWINDTLKEHGSIAVLGM